MPLVRAALLAGMALSLATAVAPAQPGAPAPLEGAKPQAAAGDAKPQAVSNGADVRFVVDEQGNRWPVIPGTEYEEFLQWKRQREAEPAVRYRIVSVALRGTADEERVLLEATVRVRVETDDQWIDVPLLMNEAVLREAPQHQGAGEGRFVADRDGGYRTLLRGKGTHDLTLLLTALPTRKVPGRRLQLSLPASVSSELKLTVPIAPARLLATVQPGEKPARPPVIQKTAVGKGYTELAVYGLGERLDLTWQELPNERQVRTVLSADTQMHFDLRSELLTNELVLLGTVKQTIQALQGSVSEVAVRLPAGFELQRLHVNRQEYQGPESDLTPLAAAVGQAWGGVGSVGGTTLADGIHEMLSRPRQVTVRLPAATTGTVELMWELQRRVPSSGELRLDGFQVRDALWETGAITIVETAEGYQLTKREGQDVYQKDALPVMEGERTVRAFAFSKQPFRLVLAVQEVAPYFRVEPHYFLRLDSDRADLVADLQFDLHRGAVQTVRLNWPGFKDEGWMLDPVEPSELVDRLEAHPDDGTVDVRLAQRRTKSFRLLLRAHRAIAPSDAAADLSLPTPATHRRPAVLLVAEADSVEAELTPQPDTTLRPMPGRLLADAGRWLETVDPQYLPDGWRELRRTAYAADSPPQVPAHEFQARMTVHPPQTAVESLVTARLEAGRLHVAQRLRYDVQYTRLSQVRLSVPASVQDVVQISEVVRDDEEVPLALMPAGAAAPDQFQVSLPEGRRGRFEVVARFALDLPKGLERESEADVTIPLVQPLDAPTEAVRFAFESAEPVAASVGGAAWSRQVALDQADQWVSSAVESLVPLSLRRTDGHDAARLTLSRALIRSECSADGFVQSRAQYRVSGRAGELALIFPPQVIVPTSFWWDDRRLELGDEAVETDPQTGEYRVRFPGVPDDREHLLTVDYRSTEAVPLGWSPDYVLHAPRLPENVWVAQTVWSVGLPADQHLFTEPEGFTPRYGWQRQSVYWSRITQPEYADLDRWIGSTGQTGGQASLGDGNAYVFSRVGPTHAMTFHSMGRSLIVLLGAGLALAAGFVLLKLPATRHAMTLLAMAVAVAAVGLWYAAPVQVLFQPALLGLVLAAAAAWFDAAVSRRRRALAPLPLSSPSDFLVPPSHSPLLERGFAANIGSEDPTALRPPPGSDSHPSARPQPSTVTGHDR